MAAIDIHRIDGIEAYTGPNTIPGLRFRPAGRALGVSAWGMNVLDFDPNCAGYPHHDHVKDGQEEVYVVLQGSATLHLGDSQTVLRAGDMVRLDAQTERWFTTDQEPATILAIGGTPGSAYAPRS